MCRHHLNAPISLLMLIALVLIPISSALAFDERDMIRLEAASRRAHGEHMRWVERAHAEQERMMAQAEALRDQTLRAARAARARMRAEARAERRQRAAARKRARRQARRRLSQGLRRHRASIPCAPPSLSFPAPTREKGYTFEVIIEDNEAPQAEDPRPWADAPERQHFEPLSQEDLESLKAEERAFNALPQSPEVESVEIIEAPVTPEEVEPEPEVERDFEALEWAIIEGINTIRVERGLSRLAYDPRLQAAAINHSEEMYRLNYFSHTSPVSENSELTQRIRSEGIGYFKSAGENLAMGPLSQDVAERFIGMWMDSPGHRDNLLTEEYRFTGVGVYGQGDRIYATQLFSERVDRSFE